MNAQMFALQLLAKNPRFANNPMAQELISVIQSGDAVKGQQIANNLCQTYGITREQAISDAKQYFKLN